MNNKAVLLRSVSAIATAAASTAGGVQHAAAQVLEPGPNGYYYSVAGGLMFSQSEQVLAKLEDKVGFTDNESSYTEFYSAGSGGAYSAGYAFNSSYSSSSSYNDLSDFKGFFGSVSFGKQLDPTWDIRGTLSATGGKTSGGAEAYREFSSFTYFSGENSAGSSFSGSSWNNGSDYAWSEGVYKFGFAAADFEVGYTPVLNDTYSVRLFAGLRALKFQSTFEGEMGGSGYESSGYYIGYDEGADYYSSSSYTSYEYYFDGKMTTEFTGVGPRIGTQMATRFEGTNFGLSGSVAASVLFGKQKVTSSGYYSSSSYSSWSYSGSDTGSDSDSSSFSDDFTSSFSEEGNKTLLDLQASIGVDYYLNDSTALTIGYQAEKLWDVGGEDMGPGTKIDVLTHGAFIKLGGTF